MDPNTLRVTLLPGALAIGARLVRLTGATRSISVFAFQPWSTRAYEKRTKDLTEPQLPDGVATAAPSLPVRFRAPNPGCSDPP